jgi:hypothetical protein
MDRQASYGIDRGRAVEPDGPDGVEPVVRVTTTSDAIMAITDIAIIVGTAALGAVAGAVVDKRLTNGAARTDRRVAKNVRPSKRPIDPPTVVHTYPSYLIESRRIP